MLNYRALFSSSAVIRTGLIGTGAFGNSFLFQMRAIPRLQATAVCDLDLGAARRACLHAGWPAEALAECGSEADARAAFDAGKIALVQDARLMLALPIDAIVEATGSPEAGAVHAQAALEHGKHVVMVSKETECVVGPVLAQMAAERGLVYTQADGDQPSMLIGLISWAETLGLEILCAGKASESDIVYDVAAGSIGNRRATVELARGGLWPLWEMAAGKVRQTVQGRRNALPELVHTPVADLCEMAIVMNATGYGYDAATLHAPVVRLGELAEVWGDEGAGGILESTGVVDVVHCLRRSDEVSFAGGVYVVFACQDDATWRLLREKGHVVSRDLSRAAVFLPYHLLGVQTATSVLSAADLKLPTGAVDARQRVDVGVIATDALRAGQRLSMTREHAIPGTRPELMPASPVAPGNAIPYYMAADNRLVQDVAAGSVLTYDMVEPDAGSALWALRRRQDGGSGG